MFSGTPRPLPPAKARRVSAALQKLSSTPPPAYGSPFTFPSRNVTVNLHGQDHEYDADELHLDLGGDSNASIDPGHLPSPDDGEEWMSEKSREELRDMLLRADGIIKERENELGIASAVAKGLYQSNVVLKSKHQELLSRLPLSPVPSNSSPELPYVAAFDSHSRTNSTSMISSSTSDSALGLIKSPRPTSLYALRQDRAPTRKVAIATADISLLADQNAELLDKLEKLEAEATSADHAGRRELKRLEKEITFLREALEKTQAKSEELEEKVQDAVVGEVWRRKKEREAKFRAMRGLGRERVRKEDGEEIEGGALGIRNFAPTGSRFGGPSDKFSFFPSREESPEPLPVRADVVGSSSNPAPAAPLQPDQTALISQLLVKVKELEETNNRILQQQSETATQLSAVQRDTAHITKVYETLADQDNIELALDEDGPEDVMQERERERLAASTNACTSAASLRKPRSTMRFMSLKRNIENELAFDDQARPGAGAGAGTEADGLDVNVDGASTFVVHPDFISSVPKNRKSVMGLFDNVEPAHAREIEDQMRQRQRDDGNAGNGTLLPSSFSSSSSSAWSEGAGYVNSNSLSFWSSSSAAAAEDRSRSDAINANGNGNASGTLSPLHFFSPALPQRRLPPLLAGRQGTGMNTGKGTNQGVVDSRSASSSPDFNYLDLASPSPSPSPLASLSALPIPSGRPTLQAELSKSVNGRERGADLPTPTTSTFNDYGNNDYNNAFNHHFRTSSLYDLSQISVPPTPSPMSRDGLTDANANSLMLSVEPPTPHKLKPEQKYKRGDAPAPVPAYAYGHGHARRDSEVLYAPPSSSLADAVKSPRIKLISDTLKSRTNRWVERRLNKSRSRSKSKSKSKSRSRERGDEDDLELELELELEENRRRPTAAPAPAIRGRLSNAVDNLIEGFNGFSSKALARVRSSRSRSGSGSREHVGEREMLAIDTAVGGVEMTEGCSPAPLSSSLPSSASSEEGEGGGGSSHLRQRQRHQRQGSAPLLIYTDSPRPSSSNSNSTSKNKDLASAAAAAKSGQSVDNSNPSLLLQVWMWFQFAVVVLVFVYAMAKRGPGSVLVEGEDVGVGAKRAVARRRG